MLCERSPCTAQGPHAPRASRTPRCAGTRQPQRIGTLPRQPPLWPLCRGHHARVQYYPCLGKSMTRLAAMVMSSVIARIPTHLQRVKYSEPLLDDVLWWPTSQPLASTSGQRRPGGPHAASIRRFARSRKPPKLSHASHHPPVRRPPRQHHSRVSHDIVPGSALHGRHACCDVTGAQGDCLGLPREYRLALARLVCGYGIVFLLQHGSHGGFDSLAARRDAQTWRPLLLRAVPQRRRIAEALR